MRYTDVVYGENRTSDKVIVDLIKSKPVQRLKGITQHGATVYNKNFKGRVITRFEHSLGVYLFLKRFGCSIEEQIAGLLHDVGHTVFSHVADLLFPHSESSFDDRIQEEIITKSEIPGILKSHNISLSYILDKSNFPILEKPLPSLCADRVDYFLRDSALIKSVGIKKFLSDMQILNKKIVFKTPSTALSFAKQYLNMDKTFWADKFQEYLYAILAEIIGIALTNNILTIEDLHTTEKEVMKIIFASDNAEIKRLKYVLSHITPNEIIISSVRQTGFVRTKSKVRVVDPLTLIEGRIVRVSSLFPEFMEDVKNYKKEASRVKWIGLKN